ncbi:MAG: PAS domain S-box protein [bacterium]
MALPPFQNESDDQLRQIADQAAIMFWTDGPDGRSIYRSKHWLEFTGSSLDRELADGWLRHVHPDDLPRRREVYAHALRHKERFSVEYRVRRHDGEFRWILESGAPQVGPEGRFDGFMGTCIDITDRKRTEERLRESEVLYRQMFEKNNAVELLVDPTDGSVVDANTAACGFYGFDAGEFLKKRLADLHVAPDGGHEDLDASIWSEAPHFFARHRLASGAVRDVEVHAGPIEVRGRRFLLYIVHDITARKEAEDRQRVLTNDLRAIVEIAYELIVCPDMDAMLRRAVELAREKLGIERCSIFFGERGYVKGTYGTDMGGRTTNEHKYFFPMNDVWGERFRQRSRQDSRWNVIQEEYRFWNGREMQLGARGWNAISPITISTGQTIAVFCNDTALTGAPIEERKQEIIMVFCSLLGSIIERRRWEEGLRMQDRLLDAVSKATNLLLTSGSQEGVIQRALGLLGEAANVDRAYIFENHRHTQTGVYLYSQRYEWAREGVAPQIDNPELQNMPYALGLMRLYNLLSTGKAFSGLVREFPEVERRVFEAQDIRSILIVPIFVQDRLWGFIGFDDCHSDRAWSTNEESTLFAMAGSIGGAIAQRQAEGMLHARDRLLQGVALATREILTATHFEEGIQRALEALGHAAGVERVYLFENQAPSETGEHSLSERFVWMRATGAQAHDVSRLQNLCYERLLPQWYDSLATGKPVSGRVRDFMRRGAVSDESRVIRSLLLVPIMIERQFWGVVGFDDSDPDRTWLAVDESTLHAVAGSIGGAIVRKRAEDALRNSEGLLRHSQKMEAVGRLAGGVAHDFNNLLTAIMGYGELILNRLKHADPIRKEVEEICKASDRAHSLTRQLLAFSRKQVLDPRLLSLNTILTEMEQLLRRMIGEDVELETSFDPALAAVKVDHGQIEQVIFNLAVNARDAMPGGGKLSIATKNVALAEKISRGHTNVMPGDYVTLSVSDTGQGMSEYVQAHIFEPFFTTKEVGKGTGLGLSMVYGIIQQSNGHIMFESTKGEGTTFTIYLPRIAGPGPVMEKKAQVETRGGSETILLVEDEEVVRKLAQRILAEQGYTLLTASNGHEALDICEKHLNPINLMLTDIVMPQISGRALAQRLQATFPNMKVLYMSGYAEDSLQAIGEVINERNFIQKPFTPTGLARKVRELLDAN